jgi:hypothetical protein
MHCISKVFTITTVLTLCLFKMGNIIFKLPYFPVDNARVIYTSKGQNTY